MVSVQKDQPLPLALLRFFFNLSLFYYFQHFQNIDRRICYEKLFCWRRGSNHGSSFVVLEVTTNWIRLSEVLEPASLQNNYKSFALVQNWNQDLNPCTAVLILKSPSWSLITGFPEWSPFSMLEVIDLAVLMPAHNFGMRAVQSTQTLPSLSTTFFSQHRWVFNL